MQTINVTRQAQRGERLPDVVMRALPYRLSEEIRKSNYPFIEEIRMRAGRRCSLVASGRNIMLQTVLDRKEVGDILEGMCQGSLYAFSDTINQESMKHK